MDKSIKLNPLHPLSNACHNLNLNNFDSVITYLKQLPYGRNTDRTDYALVLKEKKGTCSTKHAFLKALAEENNMQNIALYLGVFIMNASNTPRIKSILKFYQLDGIPEAHCYLKYNNEVLDVTFNSNDNTPAIVETLVYEVPIKPEQIGNDKTNFHKSFLKTWIKSKHLNISFDQLWKIREECIAKISE